MPMITSMSVLLVVGPKYTLAASHMLPTGESRWVCRRDRQETDGRSPDRYTTLSARRHQRNNLFPTWQSSYCRGHWTETAMLCVYNDLVRAVTASLSPLLLDHSTLLTVFDRRFAVPESATDWFVS